MSEELLKSVQVAVQGNEKFACDTYKTYNKTLQEQNKTDNILICPLSAETILALVYMGAEGNTASEMAKTLHLPSDKTLVANSFKNLATCLQSSEKVILKMANKVFVSNSIALHQRFVDVSKESFDAESETINFNNKSEALSKINDWVAKKTEDKIKNILDDLDSSTIMVLVNAVYFNGLWENPFKLQSYPMQFSIAKGKTVEVPQLNRTGMYNYYEDKTLNAQILEIPYKGGNYSMVIVLPKEIDGLANVEDKLPVDLSKLSRCEVDVTIPKFKLETSIELTDILQKMGMKQAFSSGADFSGLMSEETRVPAMISAVIQKCFIDVNEEGTEAAAATAVVMARCLVLPTKQKIYFDANHPFIFYLRHNSANINFFMGRYSKPNA